MATLKNDTPTLIHLGNSNDRQVFYLNIWTDKNWMDNLPVGNWLVFPIGQDCIVDQYANLADKCFDNNVLYVCAVGQNCELIHDIFDEVIVQKQLNKSDNFETIGFENSAMTTWHNNFSEGLWFAINVAHHELPIDKIVCIDFTSKGVKKHIANLIEKINQDWLPSDNEFEEPLFDNEI